MQFQVPQFIDAEDKIVGPFTLKQFGFLAASGGLSFLFFTFSKAWFWVPSSFILLTIGISFAFLKVNGQSSYKVFMNGISYYMAPRVYVWKPDQPNLPKTESTLKEAVGGGFSLESIVRGFAIKNAWRYIQTGSKAKDNTQAAPPEPKEQYQIFRSLTGERKAAKRVDYR